MTYSCIFKKVGQMSAFLFLIIMGVVAADASASRASAVSYTHLTLPTKLEV